MNGLHGTLKRTIETEILGNSYRVEVLKESLSDGDKARNPKFLGVFKGRACRIIRDGEPPEPGLKLRLFEG
ncbi:MAG: hypothetical protein LBS56_11140 [Propionibacteriaceae bacterium]|jgi:hypothetical protein|nr:hypothetical protein [Propionibacteriaceae bacterium]